MADDVDFLTHRGLVLQIGYDITASWVDAEDIAQQAYLRWRGVTGEVRDARAYLARIATNLALDAIDRRHREGYPGPFLPEPVPTGPGADAGVAAAAEIEVALMVVLGTLSPLERAAFLLHDVFSFSHPEVAIILDRRPDAVRQLTARARRHVAAQRPIDPPVDRTELLALTQRFIAAAHRGDVAALRAHLTDDVVFVGDGGGKRANARRPVQGSDKVARLVAGLSTFVTEATSLVPVEVNHRPAIAVYEGDELDQVLWLVLRQGRICHLLSVRNPDKLRGIGPRS